MCEFWLLVELHWVVSEINEASLSSYAAATDDDAVAALATDACKPATEIAAPDVANTSAGFLSCADTTASADANAAASAPDYDDATLHAASATDAASTIAKNI